MKELITLFVILGVGFLLTLLPDIMKVKSKIMITKYQVLNELKQRIADGDFIDYTVEQKKGCTHHLIRYGSGIVISIAEESRNMYVNFVFNRNEKEEVLELLKNTKPIVVKPKQSFFKRLFSKSK